MKTKAGFLKELKDSRSGREPARKEHFTWGATLGKPALDSAQPKTELERVARAKPAAPARPTEDLPRTVTGQIDNAELKLDLANQLKTAREQRKARR